MFNNFLQFFYLFIYLFIYLFVATDLLATFMPGVRQIHREDTATLLCL